MAARLRRVDFYRDDSGEKPVAALLHQWTKDKPVLAALAKAELRQMERVKYVNELNTRPIEGERYRGLFELKVRGHDDARFLFFYEPDGTVVVVHAFQKKSQKPPRSELEVARERRRRHLERRQESAR